MYTRFVSEALRSLGWRVVLFVDRRARFWDTLGLAGVDVLPVADAAEAVARLPRTRSLVLAHAPLPPGPARDLSRRHRYCCFAHMPLHERPAEPFTPCHAVFGVSRYVLTTMKEQGLENAYPEPLYGVADLQRGARDDGQDIRRASVYDWDERKLRDRILSRLYPVYRAVAPRPVFRRQSGLTLGVVSRITPIKQFPLLFEMLAPVIRRFPDVRIEIFGSGGYASVRDLRRSLAPVRGQAALWGQQRDVARIYRMVDFVVTGLPEREALGLNVIEAQMCNTPVLAVRAPPFTETVVDGVTGYLYTDPRSDDGTDFARVLGHILAGADDLRPREARGHLARFSPAAFAERLQAAIEYALERD